MKGFRHANIIKRLANQDSMALCKSSRSERFDDPGRKRILGLTGFCPGFARLVTDRGFRVSGHQGRKDSVGDLAHDARIRRTSAKA